MVVANDRWHKCVIVGSRLGTGTLHRSKLVTTKQICAFVFAQPFCWFSYAVAHLISRSTLITSPLCMYKVISSYPTPINQTKILWYVPTVNNQNGLSQ